MRRGEDDDIDLVAGRTIARNEGVDLGPADRVGAPAVRMRLGGDPGQVEQRGRYPGAVGPARWSHSSPSMLQRVRAGRGIDALDQRHLPIRAACPADNT